MTPRAWPAYLSALAALLGCSVADVLEMPAKRLQVRHV